MVSEALARISWLLLLWSGLTASIMSTWLLMLFRKAGTTRYLPRAYWSCTLFRSTSDASLLAAGLLRMVAMIVVFPAVYALIFSQTGRAEVVMGSIIGLAHGFLASFLLPFAARRCGANPPGFMGWNLGRATPAILLLVHSVYGALLGYIYVNG